MHFGSLTDTELILLVIAGFYISECACWLPRSAVFLSSGWRGLRPRLAPEFLQNERGGLTFASPWPGGVSFVCPRPESDPRLLRELLKAETSPGNALPSGRIEELVRRMTDVTDIRSRLEMLRDASATLRLLGSLLFALTFVVGPLLYYTSDRSDVRRLWLFLGGYAAYWLLTVMSYVRSHRRTYPNLKRERRKKALMMCVSPAMAMCAADSLARGLFRAKHPLAVMAVAGASAAFAGMARQTLLELRFPAAEDAGGACDPRLRHEFRERLLLRLTEVVREVGLDPDAVTAPPAPDADARAYCPRCRQQFVVAEGTCNACAGIRLVPFADVARADS